MAPRKKLKPQGILHSKNPQAVYDRKIRSAANTIIQNAWIAAQNIYEQLVEIAQNPKDYLNPFAQTFVMNSSRILGLSLHKGLKSGKFKHRELPKIGSIANVDLAQAENRVNSISNLINLAERVVGEASDDEDRSALLPEDVDGRGRDVIAIVRALLNNRGAERLRIDKDKELRMIRILHGLYRMRPVLPLDALKKAKVGKIEKYMQRGEGKAAGIIKKHQDHLAQLCRGWEATL